MIVAFEVHVSDGQGWRIESIFDEEELAIEAAKRLAAARSANPVEVKVVRDAYDEDTNRSITRTLFAVDLEGKESGLRAQRPPDARPDVAPKKATTPAPPDPAPSPAGEKVDSSTAPAIPFWVGWMARVCLVLAITGAMILTLNVLMESL